MIYPQLHVEMSRLVFARVTAIKAGPSQPQDTPVSHYYGFAEDTTTGQTIWFKHVTHVPVLFVGPVVLRPGPVRTWSDLPRRNDLVVGMLGVSNKGPFYRWWSHGIAPLCLCSETIRA